MEIALIVLTVILALGLPAVLIYKRSQDRKFAATMRSLADARTQNLPHHPWESTRRTVERRRQFEALQDQPVPVVLSEEENQKAATILGIKKDA